MDEVFAVFNYHINKVDIKAKKNYIKKYDKKSWKKCVQPFINKGVMSIFDVPPTEHTLFYVQQVHKYVNKKEV